MYQEDDSLEPWPESISSDPCSDVRKELNREKNRSNSLHKRLLQALTITDVDLLD